MITIILRNGSRIELPNGAAVAPSTFPASPGETPAKALNVVTADGRVLACSARRRSPATWSRPPDRAEGHRVCPAPEAASADTGEHYQRGRGQGADPMSETDRAPYRAAAHARRLLGLGRRPAAAAVLPARTGPGRADRPSVTGAARLAGEVPRRRQPRRAVLQGAGRHQRRSRTVEGRTAWGSARDRFTLWMLEVPVWMAEQDPACANRSGRTGARRRPDRERASWSRVRSRHRAHRPPRAEGARQGGTLDRPHFPRGRRRPDRASYVSGGGHRAERAAAIRLPRPRPYLGGRRRRRSPRPSGRRGVPAAFGEAICTVLCAHDGRAGTRARRLSMAVYSDRGVAPGDASEARG